MTEEEKIKKARYNWERAKSRLEEEKRVKKESRQIILDKVESEFRFENNRRYWSKNR